MSGYRAKTGRIHKPKSPSSLSHELFSNPMTSKRFPHLSRISNEQLSNFLPQIANIKSPKKAPPKWESKPVGEAVIQDTRPKRPPWAPANPSQAKKAITCHSNYEGVNHPYEKLQRDEAERLQANKQAQSRIASHSFVPSANREQAAGLTKVDYFINSSDSAMKELEKLFMQKKVAELRKQDKQLRKGKSAQMFDGTDDSSVTGSLFSSTIIP
eukprot:NODE_7078_length_795_cov_111.776786_g6839_i0.p1 GENE.NODE_7078_length_795_cov_111.776786_g6839_i0~~NODE_7078_length_795_cov_111.776786_g6839_i0.p1  ORF type:complete len:213 (-),score=36.62 NODE_7078_length_795_cov_111.776786_g6839_i0:62-700(-)